LEHLPKLASKFSPAGLSLDNKILISIQPKYLERILSGQKLIEVRKRFSPRWLGSRAVLYGTHPMSSLVGEATIATITSGSPAHIWSVYGERIGATWDEFEAYTSLCSSVSAIELADVTAYVAPIGLAQLSHLTRTELRPPQSFCDLRSDRLNPWSTAVAVATLLHGRCSYLTP
jgi:predicted transcriptional regulator